MAPPIAIIGRVRIALLVAVDMVPTMLRYPGKCRPFAREPTEYRQQPAHWPIGFETTMCEQAMVTHADAKACRDKNQCATHNKRRPSEIKGCNDCQHMHSENPNGNRPIGTQFLEGGETGDRGIDLILQNRDAFGWFGHI